MVLKKVKDIIEPSINRKAAHGYNGAHGSWVNANGSSKKMGTNWNNMYKLVYDVRRKLKTELELQRINPEEISNELSDTYDKQNLER